MTCTECIMLIRTGSGRCLLHAHLCFIVERTSVSRGSKQAIGMRRNGTRHRHVYCW